MLSTVFDSTNACFTVTNLSSGTGRTQLAGVPLGTVGGTATGEVGAKVIIVGGTMTATVDSEFPAAETPADNLTNATATARTNSLTYVFDGTAWDRLRGDSTDGALVNLGANNDVGLTSFKGAANIASAGNVALSTAAATWVAARATRRSVTLKNLSTSITVYFGPATVTAANGFELKPGESISVDWVGLIQGIAASGTPTVAFVETYD